jgi:arginine utilization protein RocB
MWLIFNALLPKEQFKTHLDQIEKSAANKDWDEAKKSMKQLKNVYSSKRTVIQMNNATEILTTFDLTMGQLEASVEHEQDAAVEYAGALRGTLDFVMMHFQDLNIFVST